MKSFAALLRGVNVSGRNIIKMADLKQMFADMNFADVQTYIQSGNVVFSGQDSDTAVIAGNISAMILKTFGMTVPVLVLDTLMLKKTILENPFLKNKKYDTKFLHVTLLSGLPGKEKVRDIAGVKYGGDEIAVIGRNAYVYCPGGYGNTKLNNAFIEKKLGVPATTRNWKTICVLAGMAGVQ